MWTDSAVVKADYLIQGGGAAGMAFADQLFSDTDATMVIVDRHDQPGGHWNEAYPFVRLHQPASYYGVSSRPLGTGSIDQTGPNAGFHELASGHEVVAHFDAVMRHCTDRLPEANRRQDGRDQADVRRARPPAGRDGPGTSGRTGS